MTDRIRAGIIGPGFIGKVHAHAVRAAGGVVARVAASTPERAEAAAIRLFAEATAASADELINAGDVDVVHICTPNALHRPLAELALEAGKHVVCEKPLATSAADAEALAGAAARAELVATVPFVYRFYPTVREARARIAAGENGSLWLLHGSYLQDWMADVSQTNWRVDAAKGGASRAFGDIGVHWCDLMEFTTGHRIVRLIARMGTAHAERPSAEDGRNVQVGTEDGAVVLFETDQGAIGSVVVSQVSPGRKNRLWFSFDGTRASSSFDQELPDSLWFGRTRGIRLVPREPALLAGAAAAYARLPGGHPEGYQDAFNAFVADTYAAVAGQAPDGLPTFADGARAAAITDAVLGSATTNNWTEVAA
jgi:predicted dehydrogenase